MAKASTKLQSFFDGNRRECTLRDFHVLKDRAGVKRIKLSVNMLLTDQPTHDIPEPFAEHYLLLCKEKSPIATSKIAVVMDGATVEIFSTDTVKRATAKITGGTLQDFKLVAEGINEGRTVALEFIAYLPATADLKDWSWEHLHADFFMEAAPSQMELPVEGPAKKPKKNKQTEFDPEAIQAAAKKEVVQ